MQAVRDIIHVDSNRISHDLPVEFSNMTVELIVLPFDQDKERSDSPVREGKSMRGALKKYANPTRIVHEKDAWRGAVRNKYEAD